MYLDINTSVGVRKTGLSETSTKGLNMQPLKPGGNCMYHFLSQSVTLVFLSTE